MHIAEVLLKRHLVNEDQLEEAHRHSSNGRLDRTLIELGWASEESVLSAFAEELGMEYLDLTDFEVDRDLLADFPTAAIFRDTILPLERRNGRVLVATSDPFNLAALNELRALSGHSLEAALSCHHDIEALIKSNLGVGGDTIEELVSLQQQAPAQTTEDLDEDELAELALTASVIRLVNELLAEASAQNASDIHIEPQERGLTVRYRIDGMLWVQPVASEIKQFYAGIVTRLKIMAKLNIAEKRLPQDGRIEVTVGGRNIDVRVSIIPSLYGEGIVLRLLDRSGMSFDLDGIGMRPEVAADFRKLITIPYGIILVTGPTGHGKTTTLYSALNEIKSATTKIITIEDPVEYTTDGIMQIQVHSKIGLNFATGLRSILRHDPDVILVGEIRDRETAEIAIQAALTGHLVFSTLHSNDAAGAFTRLIDMGVEPYRVASTIAGVLAQRLVRVLCPECKQEYAPDPYELPDDFLPPPAKLWKAVGCRACRQTGFQGRVGIFELLVSDAEVRRLTVQQSSSMQIRDYAARHGLTTLRRCGWQNAENGNTGVDEVLRITKHELE
jgi:general secretion pathway protein E/type IV pilus assembly protein PilB